jgi:hypothetical protein
MQDRDVMLISVFGGFFFLLIISQVIMQCDINRGKKRPTQGS